MNLLFIDIDLHEKMCRWKMLHFNLSLCEFKQSGNRLLNESITGGERLA